MRSLTILALPPARAVAQNVSDMKDSTLFIAFLLLLSLWVPLREC